MVTEHDGDGSFLKTGTELMLFLCMRSENMAKCHLTWCHISTISFYL